jgi:hypothetical protein
VTIEDLKKLDKRLREIPDPLGTGYPTLRKVIDECSQKNNMPVSNVVAQYTAWRWRK